MAPVDKVAGLWDDLDYVERLIRAWRPRNCNTKAEYHKSLFEYLGREMIGKKIEQKYQMRQSKIDLAIDKSIFITIRKDLTTPRQLDHLIEKIEKQSKDLYSLFVVLCGRVDEKLAKQLREKARSYFDFNCRIFVK